MAEKLSDQARRGKAILDMLPDDPLKASAEMLTHAAVVCISAGFSDDDAVRSLRTSLHELREHGLGEERH